MGQMLMTLAQAKTLDVLGIDQPLAPETLNLSDVELAIFCVPALVLEQVLTKVCPYLPRDCIVADITSVKERPMQQMERVWGGMVVGTHPLFGPSLGPKEDLTVAITQGRKASAEAIAKTEGFFQTLGFKIFHCDVKTHDLAMASLQNLNFITTVAYFALLAGHKEFLPFLTPSFLRRLKAAKKMLTEDAPMFTGLFEANNNSQSLVRQYSKLLNLAAAGDIEVLCHRAQWWVDYDHEDRDGL
ncbi:MAG: prephenate dehydrogenase [Desulfovibrionaceae bacterium]|nr:prephenate dehydrogenase [Desulfovibrionaceae bacterium]